MTNKEEMLKRFDKIKKDFIVVKHNEWWASDENFILDFIESEIDLVTEEAIRRETILKDIQKIELNSIACKSLEDFIVWADKRKSLITKDNN